MVFDFLQPVSAEMIKYIEKLPNQSLGKNVVFHTETDFPNLEQVKIALITVNEYRGAGLDNEEEDFSNFRNCFYSLFR